MIRDRLPNEYLPELIEQSGESAVRAVLESHFISPAALAILLRYAVHARPTTRPSSPNGSARLQEAIENLLIKERIDLSPQLRELDQRVEAIELALRTLVVEALGNDSGRLPPHVGQKADERIQAAAKKNANIDLDQYKQLSRASRVLRSA